MFYANFIVDPLRQWSTMADATKVTPPDINKLVAHGQQAATIVARRFVGSSCKFRP